MGNIKFKALRLKLSTTKKGWIIPHLETEMEALGAYFKPGNMYNLILRMGYEPTDQTDPELNYYPIQDFLEHDMELTHTSDETTPYIWTLTPSQYNLRTYPGKG